MIFVQIVSYFYSTFQTDYVRRNNTVLILLSFHYGKSEAISPLSIALFNAWTTLALATASSSGLIDIGETGLKDITFHTRAHLVPGGGRGSSKQSWYTKIIRSKVSLLHKTSIYQELFNHIVHYLPYSRILIATDVEYDRQESWSFLVFVFEPGVKRDWPVLASSWPVMNEWVSIPKRFWMFFPLRTRVWKRRFSSPHATASEDLLLVNSSTASIFTSLVNWTWYVKLIIIPATARDKKE